MVRASNVVFTVLNIIILLISLCSIGAGVYFSVHSPTDCQKVLQKPLLILGFALLVVFIIGLIGSCCEVNWVMATYLLIMGLLIIGVLVVGIILLVVTNKGIGNAVSGRGYKEYRLGDYSHWLQKRAEKDWNEIRSCLIDAQICKSLGEDFNDKASVFYKKNLSPTQSGCCKPPSYCGYEFKNATYWTVPRSGPAVQESDCTTWSNNQGELCYGCKSCKGGVLANIRMKWRHLAIFNLCVIVYLVIVFSTGCCVRENNKSDMHSKYKYKRASHP